MIFFLYFFFTQPFLFLVSQLITIYNKSRLEKVSPILINTSKNRITANVNNFLDSIPMSLVAQVIHTHSIKNLLLQNRIIPPKVSVTFISDFYDSPSYNGLLTVIGRRYILVVSVYECQDVQAKNIAFFRRQTNKGPLLNANL